MINNALGDFKDEVVEQFEAIPKIAKKQIFGEKKPSEDKKKNTDPVTNKPVPTKKVLTQLSQATKQLSDTRLKFCFSSFFRSKREFNNSAIIA